MDIKRIVETLFTGKDEISPVLGKIGKEAEAAGNKTDTANAKLANLLSTGMKLAAGYASGSFLKGAASSIMDIGQAAEKANISLAGILSGTGIAKDFNQGLTLAASTLSKIEKDAAALPGEAEEFQQAFQAAASSIGTSGLELDAFVDMSNKMVAAGKIFGQDSAQSGRDISLLVEGRAGMDVGLWAKLAPYMGMAVSEATKFNKLKPEERVEKLLSVVGKGAKDQGKLGDMLNAYGHTWDSISSTITGTGKMLLRVGTAPLFEKGKQNAQKIADWLGKHEDTLKMLATGAGKAVESFLTPAAMVSMAGGVLGKVAFGFGPVGMILASFAGKALVGGKGINELGDFALTAAEKIGPLITQAVELTGIMYDKLSPAFEKLFVAVGEAGIGAIEAIFQFLVDNQDLIISSLQGLADAATWAAESLGYIIKPGEEGLGSQAEALAMSMGGYDKKEDVSMWSTGGWYKMAAYAVLAGKGAAGAVGLNDEAKDRNIENNIAMQQSVNRSNALVDSFRSKDYLKETAAWLSGNKQTEASMQTSNIAGGATEATMARLQMLATQATTTTAAANVSEGEEGYAAMMEANVNQKGFYERKLGELYADYMNGGIEYALDHPELYYNEGIAAMFEQAVSAEDAVNDVGTLEWQGEQDRLAAEAAKKSLTPPKAAVHQDFRHSRFDIKQQYPEGMDPDRVAVAFASDLSALGEKKLGSSILGAY